MSVPARQAPVLETIVEQEDSRRESLLHQLAHLETIVAGADVRVTGSQQHLRFVAGEMDAGHFASAR